MTVSDWLRGLTKATQAKLTWSKSIETAKIRKSGQSRLMPNVERNRPLASRRDWSAATEQLLEAYPGNTLCSIKHIRR
jgi:hypothetical protein